MIRAWVPVDYEAAEECNLNARDSDTDEDSGPWDRDGLDKDD